MYPTFNLISLGFGLQTPRAKQPSGDQVKLFDPLSFEVKTTPIILKDPSLTYYEWYKMHGEHQGPVPEVPCVLKTEPTISFTEVNVT